MHYTCEGGCSNGESLVAEHCQVIAVRVPAGGGPQEIACVLGDLPASEPLPDGYTVATSGPFTSHARLLMMNEFCVLASSKTGTWCMGVKYCRTHLLVLCLCVCVCV
jgi:hypothetical protein